MGVSDRSRVFLTPLTTHREAVISLYADLGCIKECSTDGISLCQLPQQLRKRQWISLAAFGMKCLQVAADTIQGGFGW